ncbi:MAG: phosphoglucosamine mutase, partial [Bacteroidota bacterium]
EGINLEEILASFKASYSNHKINDVDGVRVDFQNSWVHLRKSNTEPIIRVYSEAPTQEEADKLADKIISEVQQLV